LGPLLLCADRFPSYIALSLARPRPRSTFVTLVIASRPGFDLFCSPCQFLHIIKDIKIPFSRYAPLRFDFELRCPFLAQYNRLPSFDYQNPRFLASVSHRVSIGRIEPKLTLTSSPRVAKTIKVLSQVTGLAKYRECPLRPCLLHLHLLLTVGLEPTLTPASLLPLHAHRILHHAVLVRCRCRREQLSTFPHPRLQTTTRS
jgi:hypothetical protein